MDRSFFVSQAMAMERSLYCVARSYLSSPADCEDALQTALLRAWEKRGSLREQKYFNTWLTRIMINCCKELLRRQRREIATDQVPEAAAPAGGDGEIWRQLAALDEKYRIVLVLYYRDGYSVQEIGRILRQPPGTVKSRLSRAREKLRAQLIKEEVTV